MIRFLVVVLVLVSDWFCYRIAYSRLTELHEWKWNSNLVDDVYPHLVLHMVIISVAARLRVRVDAANIVLDITQHTS